MPQQVLPYLSDPATGEYRTLEDCIRVASRSGASTSDALATLQRLNLLDARLNQTTHRSLADVPYTLEVGDVVKHNGFGHVGVVAARLPVCLEDDEWIEANLSSQDDLRLRHPWYLILVAHHPGVPMDFIRYGSQLTHEKLSEPHSIGLHRNLPLYFKGYDRQRGYIPWLTQKSTSSTPMPEVSVAPVELIAAPVIPTPEAAENTFTASFEATKSGLSAKADEN